MRDGDNLKDFLQTWFEFEGIFKMATSRQVLSAVQIWIRTGFSVMPTKARILRCPLIHL